MADRIFEITRQVGPVRDTQFNKTQDNENVNFTGSETMAIEDAGGPETYGAGGDARLLDAAEVARRLHVSRSLVYKMIERRQIPAIRIGRCVRIDPHALEEAIRNSDLAR